MYKVLLADDENIILESMKVMLDWKEYDIEIVDIASNGNEAYEKIMKYRPNIVITDIKMPGMSGLDLILATKEQLPQTVFLILSGYGEFEFASKAISLGVKHYLLKPCDEEELVSVLQKVIRELRERESREEEYAKANRSIQKIIPFAKEQFFRDFIISQSLKKEDYIFFKQLFKVPQSKLQLLLFKADQEWDVLEKYMLQNIVEDCLEKENIYLSIPINDKVLVIRVLDESLEIQTKLKEVMRAFKAYFNIGLYIAIGSVNQFDDIGESYMNIEARLQYSFYIENENIVGEEEIRELRDIDKYGFEYSYDNLTLAVRSQEEGEVNKQLEDFFKKLSEQKKNIYLARYYCMELAFTVVRKCKLEKEADYIEKVTRIAHINSLKNIEVFMKNLCKEILEDQKLGEVNRTIDKVLTYIKQDLGNPNLTITWFAKNVLFMNENYLGRLFYKEVNEKFSHYLARIRIDKAKEILRYNPDIKMVEICEQIGFMEDTQYFSQVFKRYVGCTPTEYRRSLR